MIVDLSKFAKECSCGHKHTITVKDIWIEENAVSHLENILIHIQREQKTMTANIEWKVY